MADIWDEAAIREELAKLDAKTGWKGASLPIRFTNSKRTLGSFCNADGGSFQFSNCFYRDPNWPRECALDVIRHEYAHYLDFVKYGGYSHGKSWKRCCIEVGADPIRLYNPEKAAYFSRKHTKEAQDSAALDELRPGSVIIHPTFGVGTITEIAGEGLSRSAAVSFAGEETKRKLLLTWIRKNCEVQGEEGT